MTAKEQLYTPQIQQMIDKYGRYRDMTTDPELKQRYKEIILDLRRLL